MPTYEYLCSSCEHSFDKILKIADREVPTQERCPNCNSENCITLSIVGASLMSPFRVDGLKKPHPQFKERMQQIKQSLGHRGKNVKDY